MRDSLATAQLIEVHIGNANLFIWMKSKTKQRRHAARIAYQGSWDLGLAYMIRRPVRKLSFPD
ncbi:MAG: hypothetical protein L0Y50_00730, partial [Beijerinckiaceae bacterium]|nr:hypothetical protein [Beijerinckiaceae bacterium]